MSEGLAAKYADVLVNCPIPGMNSEPMALGEFLKTEPGQRVGAQALKNAEIFVSTGMSDDEAMKAALLGSAEVGEDGNFIRSAFEPDSLTLQQPEMAKKKSA